MGEAETIQIEATVHDVRMHNSKLEDESWVDITVRVAGEANITAAMLLHRAEAKLVTMKFRIKE